MHARLTAVAVAVSLALVACKAEPASIAIEPAQLPTLTRGKGVQLKAQTRDPKGMFMEWIKPEWSSADPSIAKVADDGLVTPMSSGTTDIKATYQGLTATAPVKVKIIGSITFEPKGPIKMKAFKKLKVTAIVKDDKGNVLPDEKVYYERSGQEIDVFKDGTVALEAVGNAQVIARSGGVEGRLDLEITEP